MSLVPESVLWLLGSGHETEENLRKEARKRNIDDGRLVFARPCGVAEHLERHRHADLFLDTFIVNAHTTASDALWAGVPVVTLCGQQFAARVAASLLTNIGLEELVTYDLVSYERLVIDLATDGIRLKQLQDKIQTAKSTSALFDTKTYVHHYERALLEVFNRYSSGKDPADIDMVARQG